MNRWPMWRLRFTRWRLQRRAALARKWERHHKDQAHAFAMAAIRDESDALLMGATIRFRRQSPDGAGEKACAHGSAWTALRNSEDDAQRTMPCGKTS